MRFSLQSRELSPTIDVVLDSGQSPGAVEERTVHVDHPLFRSRSRILSSEGRVVIEGENFAKSDLHLRSEQLPPPVILAITLDGSLPESATSAAGTPHSLPRSYGVFYRPEPRHLFRLDGGRRRQIFEVNLSLDYLATLFERFPSLADTPLAPLAKGNAVALHSRAGALLPSMLSIAHDILASVIHGAARTMFVEAKIIELLTLQLSELSDSGRAANASAALSRKQVERMRHAREVLLSEIVAPPTLRELSRVVGTNEYRLKRDFKTLFGRSVFEYLYERRMEMTVERLRDTASSIEQIAGEVGYSSAAHLSTAFRRRFGYPPSRLRGR